MGGGFNSLGLSPAELAQRQRAVARILAPTEDARRELAQAEAQRRLVSAREAAQRAAIAAAEARERPAARLSNPFDIGEPKAKWEREGAPRQRPEACDEAPRAIVSREAETEQGDRTRQNLTASDGAARVRRTRRKLRPWKQRERKEIEAPSALKFARDRAWTKERSQALAVRTKKNDAIIASPRAAEAALKRLPLWSQASVRRALKAEGWTFADECGRRHLTVWASLEDWARMRAWQRPKRIVSSSGAVRFAGLPRYGLAVVGWTQAAIAIAISGAGTTDGGADPVDEKTVQRHVLLAMKHGGLQRVVRNPEAEPHLRGPATAANPQGWPINEYWIPALEFHKPGFTGQHYDADGNPVELEAALAIELIPAPKWKRRQRESQQAPPPTAA